MSCSLFRIRYRSEIRWALLGLAVISLFFWMTKAPSQHSLEEWEQSPIWAEDRVKHINSHNYKYLINQPGTCGHHLLDLLIFVTSPPDHGDRREAIRQTWASQASDIQAKVLFLIGKAKPEVQTQVQKESDTHNDILQEDFEDTYRNLTLKTVMGLKWASIFCPQAKYVMKTDDDIFINMEALHRALMEEKFSSITGCIKNGPQSAFQPLPDPDNPFDIDKLPPAHPAFVAGAGYIIPGHIVQDLYLTSLDTKMFPVEDVYTTAHCARRIGQHPPVHDRRFSCGHMVQDKCEMTKMFTGHKVGPSMQFEIMEALKSKSCPTKSNND